MAETDNQAAVPDPAAETTGFYRPDEVGYRETSTFAAVPDDSASHTDHADQRVTWTASEFVAHQKSSGWYVALAISTAVITGLVYLITRDLVSLVVIVISGALLGVYGGRQPRQLKYQVDWQGISIGARRYAYSDFRSFSPTAEGAFPGIIFMPLKRFALPTTMYYVPDDEDRIVAILADQLPMADEAYHDMIDSLMRRLRF